MTGLTSSTELKYSSTAFQHAFAGQNAAGNTGGDSFVAKFSSAGALRLPDVPKAGGPTIWVLALQPMRPETHT